MRRSSRSPRRNSRTSSASLGGPMRPRRLHRAINRPSDRIAGRPLRPVGGNGTGPSRFGHFCAEVPKSLHICAYPRAFLFGGRWSPPRETPARCYIRSARLSETCLVAMQKVEVRIPSAASHESPASAGLSLGYAPFVIALVGTTRVELVAFIGTSFPCDEPGDCGNAWGRCSTQECLGRHAAGDS